MKHMAQPLVNRKNAKNFSALRTLYKLTLMYEDAAPLRAAVITITATDIQESFKTWRVLKESALESALNSYLLNIRYQWSSQTFH